MAIEDTAQTQETFIPFAESRAFVVEAGQTVRIRQPAGGGGQVGDLNAWNLHDPCEHFWGSRTALFQTAHISTGDQLHSTWPGERPIMSVVAISACPGACTAPGSTGLEWEIFDRPAIASTGP